MVHDGVGAAELTVFLAERLETMRTGHHDGVKPVGVERRDVLGHEGLCKVFIPHPPRRIAGALFFNTEDREVHPGDLHERGEGARNLPVPCVVRSGAADPEQDVGLLPVGHPRDVESLRPVRTRGMPESPRGEIALQIGERGLQLIGETRFVQNKGATEIHDRVHMLDHHGAFLHTGHARRAGPQLLLRDKGIQQPVLQHRGRRSTAVRKQGRLLQRAGPQINHDLLRTQQLAGEVGGTGGCAPPAFGAGIPVEQLLPGEVLDVRGTVARQRFIGQIDRLQRPFRREVRQKHVGNGREDMEVLRVGKVVEKAEHREHVPPEEHQIPSPRAVRRNQAGQPVGDDPRMLRRTQHDDPGGVLPEHRHHDGQDQPEDEDGIPSSMAADVQTFRRRDQTAHKRCDNRKDHQTPEEVGEENQWAVQRTQKREREAREESFADRLKDCGQQDDKAPEDKKVQNPGKGLAQKLGLPEGDRRHSP